MFSEKDKQFIPELLKSLPPWAEVIICETKPWDKDKWQIRDINKSPDNSRIMATINHPKDGWRYDYGRNYAQRLATRPWILAIDADERVNPLQWDFLKQMLIDTPPHCGGYYVTQYSWVPAITDKDGNASRWPVASCRIYRNIPPHRWIFPIHEDISPAIRDSGYDIFDSKITLEHLGFAGTKPELIEKLKRNLKAIWRHPELAEEPRYFDYIIGTAVMYQQLNGVNNGN
jgi:hypothetical protein